MVFLKHFTSQSQLDDDLIQFPRALLEFDEQLYRT